VKPSSLVRPHSIHLVPLTLITSCISCPSGTRSPSAPSSGARDDFADPAKSVASTRTACFEDERYRLLEFFLHHESARREAYRLPPNSLTSAADQGPLP
jgi:hypothetical protein